MLSLLLASAAVNMPMLTRLVLPGASAHSGHGHTHGLAHGHHHHHHFLAEVSLVFKTVYGADTCDLRYCELEPYRNTTLVAVVGDDDANSQTETSANAGKLRSDLELLEHSLAAGEGQHPERKAFLEAERRRLQAALEAAQASEALGSAAELTRLQWTIERGDAEASVAEEPVLLGTGRHVTLSLNGSGTYMLSLALEGDPQVHLHFMLEARYSRRDIESMLPSDRAAFFKAVQVLYSTPAEEGRQKYGSDFRTMDEVWAAHALLGGDGSEHTLLRGAVDARKADVLLDRSKPHRVPSEDKVVQGHHFEVRADANDWDEVSTRFKASALAHEQRLAALAPSEDRKPGEPGGSASGDSTNPVALAGTDGGDGGAPHSEHRASPMDDAHLGLHQLATTSLKADKGLLDATGHGLVHQSLSTNFAAFATLFEKAVQSVDPAVAVPYHAGRASDDMPAERRRGSDSSARLAIDPMARERCVGWRMPPRLPRTCSNPGHAVTRHVRHSTWSEEFVVDDATLKRLSPAEAEPTAELPESGAEAHTVGADGSTSQSTQTESSGSTALSTPPGGEAGGRVPITVEGQWAYFPVFTSMERAPGERGRRGHHEYKGYAVPLVVADVAPGAVNPFEKAHTLPPIATDHHHEMKDGQLFHTHGKGGAHRHV